MQCNGLIFGWPLHFLSRLPAHSRLAQFEHTRDMLNGSKWCTLTKCPVCGAGRFCHQQLPNSSSTGERAKSLEWGGLLLSSWFYFLHRCWLLAPVGSCQLSKGCSVDPVDVGRTGVVNNCHCHPFGCLWQHRCRVETLTYFDSAQC